MIDNARYFQILYATMKKNEEKMKKIYNTLTKKGVQSKKKCDIWHNKREKILAISTKKVMEAVTKTKYWATSTAP